MVFIFEIMVLVLIDLLSLISIAVTNKEEVLPEASEGTVVETSAVSLGFSVSWANIGEQPKTQSRNKIIGIFLCILGELYKINIVLVYHNQLGMQIIFADGLLSSPLQKYPPAGD